MDKIAEVLEKRIETIFPIGKELYILIFMTIFLLLAEPWQQHKVQHICSALTSDPLNIELLRHEARSNGGLLCNELRKRAWPKLLGVNIHKIPLCMYDVIMMSLLCHFNVGPFLEHPDKTQIILDVNRCGRRLPKGISLN